MADVGGFDSNSFSTGAFTPLAFLFEAAEAAGQPLTWDEVDRPWGQADFMYSAAKPVMLVGAQFFESDTGILTGDQPIHVVLTRTGLTILGRDRFGNWKSDPGIIKHVSGVWPMLKGHPGTVVQVSVGTQEEINDPITFEGPRDFVIGSDSFLDFNLAGRYISIRFESYGQEPWQLLSYDLDLELVETADAKT